MDDGSVSRKMWVFVTIWFGQTISVIGSSLTGFALGVWVYQQTGSVTQFSLIALSTWVPGIVIAPLSGELADRWDRRSLMILSNACAAACTVVIAIFFFNGWLALWNICILNLLLAGSNAISGPSYSASVSLLVPKKHLGRASGMMQTGQAASAVVAPLLAGILVVAINIHGILIVDFATYLFAIASLVVVRIPKPEASAAGKAAQGSLFKRATYGWHYLTRQAGLLRLVLFFAATNFAAGMANVLMPPLVLSFAGAEVYGRIVSVAGVGWLIGGLTMSVWGGLRRRIHGAFIYGLILGMALMLMGFRASAVTIAIALCITAIISPLVNSSVAPILQTKIPPDLQGRVFAAVRLIAWSTVPLSYLSAGPLADRLLGPMMLEGGLLAGSAGSIIGVGPGRGTGLLLMLLGLFAIGATVKGYFTPRLRLVEDESPDAIPDAQPAAVPASPSVEREPAANSVPVAAESVATADA